jgi:predicted nucleotidyltransferase
VASTQVSALLLALPAQFLAFRGAQAEIGSVSIGDLPIKVDRSAVADFCSQRGIRRLALFGSVLRRDFNPETSDVDVLADFQPGALRGLGLGYFDFGPDLSRILGYRVDFCSKLNRHIRPLVEREMLVIYEQP